MGCQTTTKKSLGFVKVRSTPSCRKKQKSEKTQLQDRKAVRFSRRADVAFRHVTREELGRTWYRSRDYDSFKSDCKKTAREYAAAGGDITQLDPMKVCLRGLEQSLTRNLAMRRRMFITSCTTMVLRLQKSQSPESLREMCKVVSQSAADRAVTVAGFDEKLARL